MHEHLAGAGGVRTGAGAEKESYTCEHVLVEGDGPIYTNAATVKGGEKEKETPPVEVEVEERHTSKSRRNSGLLGKLAFTTAKLSSEAGKKVEYLITVKNTGNTTLKFTALKDSKCLGHHAVWGNDPESRGIGDVQRANTRWLKADENPYKNTASISGGGIEKTSNTVEVEIKKPNFEIKKEQRIKGEAELHDRETESRSRGRPWNTRSRSRTRATRPLKFEALKDAKCTNFSPALGAFELAPGAEKSLHVRTRARGRRWADLHERGDRERRRKRKRNAAGRSRSRRTHELRNQEGTADCWGSWRSRPRN